MHSRCWRVHLPTATFLVLALQAAAVARPRYLSVFVSTYRSNYEATRVGLRQCTVCHDRTSNDKYPTNNYGEAMAPAARKAKASGETEESIRNVLKEAESLPSAIDGKTFGDLIREGRLPASK